MRNKMDSRKQSFIENLIQEIEIDRVESGEGLRKSFVHCLYERLPDADQGSINLVYFNQRIKGKPVEVDGYFYDDDDRTLYLVIADFHNFENNRVLNRKVAEDKIKALRNFTTFAAEGFINDYAEFSTPEYDLASLIYDGEKSCLIDRFRLVVLTDQSVSERFVFLSQEPLLGHPVDIQIWDFGRLYDFVSSGQEREPITLNFSDTPIPLAKATTGKGFNSYLGVMPADLLADIYKVHGSRLLEGNVRSFLTLKSGVNKKIYETVCKDPGRFFVFNNGIAITAKDLKFDKSGALIEATDFQIINGGQTTATLSKAKYDNNSPKDLSSISVAMKLTEIGEELTNDEAQELIRNISRSSNTQNKVSEADLSSNHEFHIQLEKQSERIVTERLNGLQYGTYWFYERSRGRYEQKQLFMTNAQKERFKRDRPKSQVFKKEDVAKVHLTWDRHPNIVSKGAASCFTVFMNEIREKWENRDQTGEFGDQYYRKTIALLIIWKKLEELIPKQDWYHQGYRANIITYSLALFSKYYEKKFGKDHFDFDLIWRKQEVPSFVTETLLNIAKTVLQKILESEDRDNQNVTQWAKMLRCWEKAEGYFEHILHYELPSTYANLTKTEDQIKEDRHQNKTIATIDKSVANVTAAMDYQYWHAAVAFAEKHSSLPPRALATLRKMTFIKLGRLPADRAIVQAFALLDQLREEGFDH